MYYNENKGKLFEVNVDMIRIEIISIKKKKI